LRQAIETTHAGNQSEFAQAIGMTGASISRLCAGTRELTRATLEKIVIHLPEDQRKKIYLAAIRDFLPEEAIEIFFKTIEKSKITVKEDEQPYENLDPGSKRVLDWLNQQAPKQPEVRTWLRILAKWMNLKE
jgi:transcriptional regulator with XRE-family HTH domain